MAKTMPPFAVLSNLVIIKPVKLCILENSSTWFKAFCPVVASRTKIISLG